MQMVADVVLFDRYILFSHFKDWEFYEGVYSLLGQVNYSY